MRIALWIAAAVALALPASGAAAVECDVEDRDPDGPPGNALAVTATVPGDGVAIARRGDEITIADDRTGGVASCGDPPPTVRSIDSIELSALGEESFLYLDLVAGRFGPGATREPERSSEIEVSAEWPSGFLGVGGTREDDEYSFGTLGRGTFGYLTPDPDAELTAPDVVNVLARGRGGDDIILSIGPLEDEGSDVAELRIPAVIEGGRGNDLISGGRRADVLAGGAGDDLVFADRGCDDVDCGPGRDEVIAGSRAKVRHCERVTR